MKKILIAPALFFITFVSGFSQTNTYNYFGRQTPAIKKDDFSKARFIAEIMPDFFRYFSLPYNEHFLLKEQLELVNSPGAYRIYPEENLIHSQKNYEKIIDYASIEITAPCHGMTLTAKSRSEVLTQEQKNILNAADLGSDIRINIKFTYKKWTNLSLSGDSGIKEGNYSVTVIPETEAEYPGGFMKLKEYLKKNVMTEVSKMGATEKIDGAMVRFDVDELGQITNVTLVRKSSDAKTNKLILDAIYNMPKWKPAENSKGIKVKQVVSIPFGGNC